MVLQDFGIDADIATLTVTLDRVVNNESCGEMVLNVTPLSTSQVSPTSHNYLLHRSVLLVKNLPKNPSVLPHRFLMP